MKSIRTATITNCLRVIVHPTKTLIVASNFENECPLTWTTLGEDCIFVEWGILLKAKVEGPAFKCWTLFCGTILMFVHASMVRLEPLQAMIRSNSYLISQDGLTRQFVFFLNVLNIYLIPSLTENFANVTQGKSQDSPENKKNLSTNRENNSTKCHCAFQPNSWNIPAVYTEEQILVGCTVCWRCLFVTDEYADRIPNPNATLVHQGKGTKYLR